MIYDPDFAAHYVHYYLSEELQSKYSPDDIKKILKIHSDYMDLLVKSREDKTDKSPYLVEDDKLFAYMVKHAYEQNISVFYEELEIINQLELDFCDEMGMVTVVEEDDDEDEEDNWWRS
jgi:hypothetical protein